MPQYPNITISQYLNTTIPQYLNMDTHLVLEDLDIYQLAMSIGEDIWKIVEQWDFFAKKTIGEQLVKASDSIAANIAEGYGRYFFKDRKQFCYYSRGSLLETKTWVTKALQRGLIAEVIFNDILQKLKHIHHKLNIYIKKLKENVEHKL
jgi:four helix bundle protein